jgi:PleD family two-component response regulator
MRSAARAIDPMTGGRGRARVATGNVRRDLADLLGVDDLSGVLGRGPGLHALDRECRRSRRTGRPVVMAFVDVEEVEAGGGRQRRASGDTPLHGVAAAIRSQVRAYDLVVRLGGDALLVGLADIDAGTATGRLTDLTRSVALGTGHLISWGLAEPHPGEDVLAVIERSISDLCARRQRAGAPQWTGAAGDDRRAGEGAPPA